MIKSSVTVDDLDVYLGRLDEFADERDVVVQAFDSRYVASRRHLELAVEKAERAFERGENVADDLGMEVMLYAAGTRQIDVATRVGLKEGDNDAVFVTVGGDAEDTEALRELVGEDSFDYGDDDLLVEFFGITDDELDAVGEEKLELLVLERVALLDIDK